MSVEGKVVAITGASGGIGEATAFLLAGGGAKLVLGARRDDRLAILADRIAGSGGAAVHRVTDVRRRGDLADLVDLARERFGKLDVLVSNAGIGPISPLDALRVDEWEDMVDVNIKGVLYGVAAALPIFRAQGFGHFITVASTAGLKTVANQSVYSATKYSVVSIVWTRQRGSPRCQQVHRSQHISSSCALQITSCRHCGSTACTRCQAAHESISCVAPCVPRILRRSRRTTSWQSRRATRISIRGADGQARISPMIAPPSRPVSWSR